MSVNSDNYPLTYTLTGSAQVVALSSYFLENGDLLVTKNSGGTITTLAIDDDYTLAGAGNEAGGTLTMVAGANADIITISRNATIEQPEDLTTAGAFPATTIEVMVDRIAMQVQQIKAEVKRALRLTLADSVVSALAVSSRVSKYLGFDASGNLELKVATNGAGDVLSSNLANSIGITDAGSGTGVAKLFDGVNAPTVSLTEGTWSLTGGVTARTSDGNDTIWAQFFDNTDSVAFGGGPAVNQPQVRSSLPVTGTITVPTGETHVIYFKVFVTTWTLDVGCASPNGPAGFISAVRIA